MLLMSHWLRKDTPVMIFNPSTFISARDSSGREIPASINPARHENIPEGKLFLRPSRHWFPSAWITNMITTGSAGADRWDECERSCSGERRPSTNQAFTCQLWDSRCCGRPGDFCSLLSNRSSCSLPLLLVFCFHTSGKSCICCATRGRSALERWHLCVKIIIAHCSCRC